jgi:hypothetical protein
MKNSLLLLVCSALLAQSCVQKTYNKTVVFTLNTAKIKNIETVGLRGAEKPLSWETDLPLTVVKKDSLYQVTTTYLTGYKFTEVKFVINGTFELRDQPNRRVTFAASDTTFYNATYDVAP